MTTLEAAIAGIVLGVALIVCHQAALINDERIKRRHERRRQFDKSKLNYTSGDNT